jgi:hypothetical protein
MPSGDQSQYRAAARSGLIIASLACAFASHALPAGQNNQPQATNGPQSTQTDQRGSKASPVIVTLTRAPKSEQEAADIAQAAREQTANNNRLIWLTLVLACVAALQWLAMLFQTRHVAKSVGAAQRSAKAAEDAVGKSDAILTHAQETSRRELRAYIAVAPMGVAQLIGREQAIGQVQLYNVGKLPARNVDLYVRMALDERLRTEFQVSGDEIKFDRVIQPGHYMR